MKKLVLALAALMVFAGSALAKEKEAGIFVNLTSTDLLRAPMAVHFAMRGLERDIPMTLFLNGEGVRLAVAKFNVPTNAKTGQNIHDMLKMFMKKGGKVIICPMCLSANGYEKSDLIEGVTMGSPDIVFPAIMESEKVISY